MRPEFDAIKQAFISWDGVMLDDDGIQGLINALAKHGVGLLPISPTERMQQFFETAHGWPSPILPLSDFGGLFDRSPYAPSSNDESIAGIPVVLDPTLPPGEWEVRSPDGKLLRRVSNNDRQKDQPK